MHISLSDAELYCVDRGSGIPLLLVHGFPLDHTMWSAQIEDLSTRCRVIAPDLRGFGRSRAKKGDSPRLCAAPGGPSRQMGTVPFFQDDIVTMEQFADDLAALLDALEVAERIVLCGLSMGGYIAFQFWRKYAARLRGLVLCDTRAPADAPDAAAGRLTMADRVLREGPAPMVESMLPRAFAESTRTRHPEVIDRARQVMMSTDPHTIAAALRGMAQRPDMTASLPQINCPTLVLVGAEDILSTPAEMRSMAESIPGAKFVEIPDAGHVSPIENPIMATKVLAELVSHK
jgi:3-oxoadipate enol-lactonase